MLSKKKRREEPDPVKDAKRICKMFLKLSKQQMRELLAVNLLGGQVRTTCTVAEMYQRLQVEMKK